MSTEVERPGWDEYFLSGAAWVATRADCTRRQVGAVVVKEHRIMATGYNGAPSQGPSCLKGECPRGRLSLEDLAPGTSYDTGAGACIALHAEQNAIMYCSMEQRTGATIYITDEPCGGCFRMIAGSGITRIVWPGGDSTRWINGRWDRILTTPPRR